MPSDAFSFRILRAHIDRFDLEAQRMGLVRSVLLRESAMGLCASVLAGDVARLPFAPGGTGDEGFYALKLDDHDVDTVRRASHKLDVVPSVLIRAAVYQILEKADARNTERPQRERVQKRAAAPLPVVGKPVRKAARARRAG